MTNPHHLLLESTDCVSLHTSVLCCQGVDNTFRRYAFLASEDILSQLSCTSQGVSTEDVASNLLTDSFFHVYLLPFDDLKRVIHKLVKLALLECNLVFQNIVNRFASVHIKSLHSAVLGLGPPLNMQNRILVTGIQYHRWATDPQHI